MAAHACLKNEFTEVEKYHNLMRWLIWPFLYVHCKQHIFVPIIYRYMGISTGSAGVYVWEVAWSFTHWVSSRHLSECKIFNYCLRYFWWNYRKINISLRRLFFVPIMAFESLDMHKTIPWSIPRQTCFFTTNISTGFLGSKLHGGVSLMLLAGWLLQLN